MEADPDFKPVFASWEKAVADYPKAKAKYDEDMIKWKEEAKKANDAGTKPIAAPRRLAAATPSEAPAAFSMA